jgi:hypothetical protein
MRSQRSCKGLQSILPAPARRDQAGLFIGMQMLVYERISASHWRRAPANAGEKGRGGRPLSPKSRSGEHYFFKDGWFSRENPTNLLQKALRSRVLV